MFNAEGFKVMKGLTDALTQRQEILSNNLANMGTKNYVRQDIDFGRVLSDLKSGGPSMEQGNEATLTRARYKDTGTPLTLESEMSKMYDNHLRYLLMVKSISHHFEHMKKAIEVKAS